MAEQRTVQLGCTAGWTSPATDRSRQNSVIRIQYPRTEGLTSRETPPHRVGSSEDRFLFRTSERARSLLRSCEAPPESQRCAQLAAPLETQVRAGKMDARTDKGEGRNARSNRKLLLGANPLTSRRPKVWLCKSRYSDLQTSGAED